MEHLRESAGLQEFDALVRHPAHFVGSGGELAKVRQQALGNGFGVECGGGASERIQKGLPQVIQRLDSIFSTIARK